MPFQQFKVLSKRKSISSNGESVLTNEDATLPTIHHNREKSLKSQSKSKWLTILMDKENSPYAVILDRFFLLIMILSVCVFCSETLAVVQKDDHLGTVLFWVDVFTILIFTLELTLNCLMMKHWKEIFSWNYFIDIAAIVPFYVEVTILLIKGGSILDRQISGGFGAIRVLKIFGAARLFKVFQKSKKLKFMMLALKDSFDGIFILIFAILILTIFYSTLIYYTEQTGSQYINNTWVYPDGTETAFQSIPGSFFIIVLSLMGNPPEFPRSILGRAVIVMAMITYLLIIAFPLTIISMSYSKMARKLNDKAVRKKEIRKMKSRSKSFPSVSEYISNSFLAAFDNNDFESRKFPSTIYEASEDGANDHSQNEKEKKVEVFSVQRERSPVSENIVSPPTGACSQTPSSRIYPPDILYETPSNQYLPSPQMVSAVNDNSLADNVNQSTPHVNSSSSSLVPSPPSVIKSQGERVLIEGENMTIQEMELDLLQKLGKKSKSPKVNLSRKSGPLPTLHIRNYSTTNATSSSISATQKVQSGPSSPAPRKRRNSSGSIPYHHTTAFDNLSHVSLRVVDWQYTLGPPKRDLTYEDESEDGHDEVNKKATKPLKIVGGDLLSIKLAIRNPEQLRRLLRTLSEFD